MSPYPCHELRLHAVGGATVYSELIDGYVTSGLGPRTTIVTVNPDRSVTVMNSD